MSRTTNQLIKWNGSGQAADSGLAYNSVMSGAGYNTAFNPATDFAWLSYGRASDIVGGLDGDAVTTLPQSYVGAADAFTGTGTLKKAGNGITNQNVVRFNGTSNKFSTTIGGGSLTGNFYAAFVVKFISNPSFFSQVATFGDNSNALRRSISRSDPDFGSNYRYGLVNGSTDNAFSSAALADGTAYFLEVTGYLLATGTVSLTFYVNGQPVYSSPTQLSAGFSSTIIRLGANVAGTGEFGNFDLAEWFFAGSVPSEAVRTGLKNYVATTYPAISMNTKYPASAFTGLNTLGESFASNTGVGATAGPAAAAAQPGATIIGGAGLFVGCCSPLPMVATGGANFPVVANNFCGGIAADVQNAMHLFRNKWTSNNTLAIQNTSSLGFSTVTFHHYLGKERGAIGYAHPLQEPWGSVTGGGMFMEISNFTDTGVMGIFRMVQTKSSGKSLRQELKSNGDYVWYSQDLWDSAPVSGTYANLVKQLTLDVNGNLILGNPGAAQQTLAATNGFLIVPSCAGTPSGVPAGITAGKNVALRFDDTAGKLWVYYSAAWHYALLV